MRGLPTNGSDNDTRYLVDITGYPVFEPIPLDFEKESPVYENSFLEYKFVWESPDCVVRYHRKGESRPIAPGEVIVDGWRRVCVIDLSPKGISFFDEPMHKVYGQPDLMITPFHHSLRLVTFLPSDSGKDLRSLCVKDKLWLVANDRHNLEPRELASGQDVVDKIGELFPILREDAGIAVKYLKL